MFSGTGITLSTSGDNVTITNTAPHAATNLSTAYGTSSITIASSTGSNTSISEASGSAAGLMSTTHHNKLDGIEATATADQNTFSNIQDQHNGTNTVLHSADATADTFTIDAGDGITIANGTDKITIDLAHDQRLPYSAGAHVKVGHAGCNGKAHLDFNVATAAGDTGHIDVYTAASGLVAEELNFKFDGAGTFHADGDIVAYSSTTASDAKLKTNIKTVENALDKVCQLDGVTFDWIRDGKESAGVIAQNVEDVLPRAVKEVKDLKGDDSHKVVDYNQLSALFIEAIKELKDENKSLRAEIESLKDINS
jgi:hypothetical protein